WLVAGARHRVLVARQQVVAPRGELDEPPLVVAVTQRGAGARETEVGGVEVRRHELLGDRRVRVEARVEIGQVGERERRTGGPPQPHARPGGARGGAGAAGRHPAAAVGGRPRPPGARPGPPGRPRPPPPGGCGGGGGGRPPPRPPPAGGGRRRGPPPRPAGR